MKKSLLTLLLFCSFFFGNAQDITSRKPLEDSIVTILKKNHIPGVFITVVSKDSVMFKSGFGYADISLKTKTNTEHLFKIGSVSKTFTALAIMKLVEEGTLRLEDKLADIAPEIPFQNKWKTTHPVKVKHLLEHKAGFDDMPISVIAADRSSGMTAFDEVLKNKGALKSRWQPGIGHSYSNPGYAILGYLIEKITNQPYQDYIKNNILVPLNMKYTDYRSNFDANLPSDTFAVGYMRAKDTLTESRDAKIIGESAGALLSNANDMSHFLQFMLNQKLQDSRTLVSASSIKEMETLHGDLEIINNINRGYSLGLYTRTFGTESLPFIGHNGGINGFASDFIYSRELDLGIAISNNGEAGNGKIIDLLVDTFAKDIYVKKMEQGVDVTQFSEWEGTYRMLTTRNQLFDFIQFPLETVTIEVAKDSLFLTRFLQQKDTFISYNGIAFGKKNHQNPALFLAQKEDKKYLNYHGDILVPVNGPLFLVLRILLVLCLVVGAISIVILLINTVLAIFKKRFRPLLKSNFIITLPVLTFFISLLLLLSNATFDKLETLGQFNVLTIFIFLLTTLFPVASIWAAYWLYKNKTTITRRFFKVYYHLLVFCALFLSIYCMYHGWFLKMMWA